MSDIYNRYYANGRHDGSIETSLKASGDIAWRRIITGDEKNLADTQVLLSGDNNIVIDCLQKIYIYSSEGALLREHDKYYGCQIALMDGAVYYISPDQPERLNAVTLAGESKLKNFLISGITSNAHLAFYEPLSKGLIAQIQYMSSHDTPAEEILVYYLSGTKLGFDWSRSFPQMRSPLIPLVDIGNRRLVTSLSKEIAVFDLDSEGPTPEPVDRFPMPLGENTFWMSCSKDGRLHFAGNDSDGLQLIITDFAGEEFSRLDNNNGTLRVKPIAPPIITDSIVYILTESVLIAVENNSVAWTFKPLRGQLKYGTALSDGSILLAASDMIYHMDKSGEYYFEVVVDEPIVAPPVVDGSGKVYVAGKGTLYAIA